MGDNLTPADRLKTMRAVKGSGNRLERRLFATLAALHVTGWRRNDSGVIGKPDAAFADQRVAIFIDGCFWHGCPYCKRKMPVTNADYWQRKIDRNITQARQVNRQLRAQGWRVLRIWEHEMHSPVQMNAVKTRILKALNREPHEIKH
jgi:DNA mismatch endonuclease (patch repair protein)